MVNKKKKGEVWPQRIAVSRRGMVAAQHYRATEAGVEALEEGGNAIDAAVAAAFALGVCEPQASGLGGQTMMLIHLADSRRTFALDGSSRAPNRVAPGALHYDETLSGHRAATVPSTPAVLAYALDNYGRLPLPRVIEPAVRLAEGGYGISALQRALAKRELKRLRENGAGAFFLRDGVKQYPVGELFKQPVLAETLKRIANAGVEDFYVGKIAKAIHDDMVRHEGLIRKDDLAQIPWPIERKPVACRFSGRRVMTFPPPGAGRVLIEMLNVLSNFPLERWDPDRPKGAHLLTEVIRRANLDRRDRPFDPNYYPQIQDSRMMSQEYAKLVAGQVRSRLRPRGETTHLSVMDAEGNAVSLTQSIERLFGACALCPELGFLYNNYMSAFEYEEISHPYYLRPNAVPWASVAPTIVFIRRKPWLAIGSPGSERIAPTIMQVMLRLMRQSPMDAVSAPRLHCSLEGEVSLEASRMSTDVPKRLRKRGYRIDERGPYSFYLGCVQLVMRDKKEFIGVADPRRDGSAGGPKK
jgi:gamma-glutamyltranspeptidase/glutathione hydrolase